MKKVAFCPADANNDKFFNQLQNSLRKFHTEEELPLIRYDLKDIQDPMKWYRATPMIAKDLIKEYELVIKLDADQIITGKLDKLWEVPELYDVQVVLNDPTYPIAVWDIQPYYNNGLVVLRDPDFINHWWELCVSKHFDNYQFREQDLLNILCSDYFGYDVRCLDANNQVYGECAKPFWAQAYLKDDKLYIPTNGEEVQLNVIHFGGGADPSKGNFKIRFKEDVVKWLEKLIQ